MNRRQVIWSGVATLVVLFTLSDCTASIQPWLAAETHILVHRGMMTAAAQDVLRKDGFACRASDKPDGLPEHGGSALASASRWLICRRDRNDRIIATCVQFVNVALDGGGQSVLETYAEQPRCGSV